MTDKKTDSPPDAIAEEISEARARETTKPIAADAKGGSRARAKSQEDTSYEEYLFGRGVLAEGAKNQAWSDTTNGRIAIRLFSRGIVGAAAFALGGRYANTHLKDYEPTAGGWDKSKPLHWIAKGFDMVLGEPIKWIAKTVAPEHQAADFISSATRFRTKAYYYSREAGNNLAGRSLGAEMVAISFDFASASIGDAGTRNIIQAFDPNIQKPWIVDGKFDFDRWMEATARATWRVVTKNAGEDWGAALPYVYQMKWQRQALAKLFPGSKLMFDYGWNGGSLKMAVNQGLSLPTAHVVGDYQLAGAIDLQCRFVGYNWYTLMYRDMYDSVGRAFTKWKKDGFSLDFQLPENPIESVVAGIGQSLRYGAKSFVKANLYMQPAVPFFWMFRTPQTKWRASAICPDHSSGYGLITHGAIAGTNSYFDDKLNMWVEPTPARLRKYDSGLGRGFLGGTHSNPLNKEGQIGHLGMNEVKLGGSFDPYAWENQKTLFSKILNPFGWISYKTGSGLVHFVDNVVKWNPNSASSKWWLGDRYGRGNQALYREMTLRSFTDAAFSYTPYMIAKAEFGLRVDDRPIGGGLGEMDKAIYGAIDSLGTLKFNDFGKYVERIGSLMVDTTHTEVISREGGETKKQKAGGDGSVIPSMSADPKTRVEKSSIVDEHKQALSHAPKDQQTWKSYIADKRESAQLHPTHPTVQ